MLLSHKKKRQTNMNPIGTGVWGELYVQNLSQIVKKYHLKLGRQKILQNALQTYRKPYKTLFSGYGCWFYQSIFVICEGI